MSPESQTTWIPYGRHTVDQDDVDAVVEALRSSHLTQGARVEAFERALCDATGAAHAVAVSSGTAALHTAYAALGLEPGDEIVTSPITFVATANAAVFLGARPVLIDVDTRRANLDPAAVESKITSKTRAIVAVDYAGHPAEMEALGEIARRRGLTLVSDASHSLGATYHSHAVGTLADLTCLSFHPVKAIATGEGGAVLTDDADLARACRRFRHHGMVREQEELEEHHGPWYHEMHTLGLNYRITDIQCALGKSQLSKLGRFVERRRTLADRYRELLHDTDGLELPVEDADVRSAWHLYVVRVPAERRRRIFEALHADGVGVQVHYLPVYRHPFHRRLLETGPADFPRAEDHYARCLSLPLFPSLDEADQDRVVEALKRALRSA